MKSNKKHETIRNLRVIYTDTERLELGKQLAEVHQDLAKTNHDFDSVKTDFKARLTAHEAKISDLSNKVSTGFHVIEVKCAWQMDTPAKLKKTLVRLDTNEVVEVEDMSEADKQGDLPLPDATPAVAGVAKDGTVKVKSDET